MAGDAATGSALFLADGRWEGALPTLSELVSLLERSRFSRVAILPERGGWQHAPLDLSLLLRALRRRPNLFHQSCVQAPFRALVGRDGRRAIELRELLHLCRWTSCDRAESLLDDTLGRLVDAGVFEARGEQLRSRVMATPLGGKLFFSDASWLREHDEYVYMGRTSLLAAEFLLAALGDTERARGGRLLDLGSGCGILALSAGVHFDEVVGTDVVDRCLAYARLNAALNEARNCGFEHSDLYSNVVGTFDVIVANPPCTWTPEGERAATHADGGADYGSELPARAITGAFERLNAGGVAYVTLTCPVIRGAPHVVSVLERALGPLGASVTVYPLFAEYPYQRARLYREHGIESVVRYLAAVHPAPAFALRFARFDPMLWWSSRASAAVPRLVAAVTGGPDGAR